MSAEPSAAELRADPPALPGPASEMAVIALGGAIGALSRFAVWRVANGAGLHGALATATVNLIGAFALGLTVGLLETRHPHPLLRPFLTIGVLGSFTTFSALALENHDLLDAAGVGTALAHLTGTIFFGLGAFIAGRRVARGGRTHTSARSAAPPESPHV